ncbi:MAG: hypothetical protein HXY25_08265 [Alphaproteobacteria bacterium]|nr:hypothetical protein [Alphaproteobacteria bacterium]
MPRPIASSPLAALGLGLALILSACAAPPAPAPMADRPQAALPVRASDVSVSFAPGA